jgi:hypothetical protein
MLVPCVYVEENLLHAQSLEIYFEYENFNLP